MTQDLWMLLIAGVALGIIIGILLSDIDRHLCQRRQDKLTRAWERAQRSDRP